MSAVLPVPAGAFGRIGPNAITQVAAVLPPMVGSRATWELFDLAGLTGYLQKAPQSMVDEAEVTRLHCVLRAELGGVVADDVARKAGLRTANYLLAHRIPRPVQAVLKRLPAWLAARVLLKAITRHAWTFSGSGEFTAVPGRPVVLTIRNNPLCKGVTSQEPACGFYAATFERLFRVLVHPDADVLETDCEACGGAACRFEIHW